MIAVGLMSGTSLDGIDAALVRITPRGRGYAVELLDFVTQPFEAVVLDRVAALLPPNAGSVAALARLHRDLGGLFAHAARTVAHGAPVDYVATHGLTVWHEGERAITLQIGDPFALRDMLGATVCFDFRSADCAAGGCGAPLVPYVDALLYGSRDEDRVAVNIGGIANVTVLVRECDPAGVIAFDTGPGNMLVDAFVRTRTKGEHRFDRAGMFALSGSADRTALTAMLADPYFALAPPKSTGRERFGVQFLAQHAQYLDLLSLEDGAATLAELTAVSIGDAIATAAPEGARVLVSGGGAHNAAIVRGLAKRLAGRRVEPLDVMNGNVDAKEAVAFAVLGYETLRGRAANVPRVTGAARAVVLGAIAPHHLDALLQRIDAECAV